MAEMSWQQALEGSGHIASMVKRVLGSMTALHNVLQEAHMLTQAQLSRILRLLRTIHWSPGSVLIPSSPVSSTVEFGDPTSHESRPGVLQAAITWMLVFRRS